MSFPFVLSMAVGFLSLSQEILWVRVMGFAFGGAPLAFSYVLALYLVGIAVGAAVGKWLCARRDDLYRVAAWILLLAAATDPLPTLLGSTLALKAGPMTLAHLAWPTVMVVTSAAIKSVLFPIAHHLGSTNQPGGVGSSVSNIYFGNIVGSTLGPWVTGFVLLDLFSIDRCFQWVALGSLLLALGCLVKSQPAGRWRLGVSAAAAVMMALLLLPRSQFVLEAGERWVDWNARRMPEFGNVRHVVENKHGVIHTVAQAGRTDDVIYGGNIYDGRVSYDLRLNSNGIDRVYLLAALHPKPVRVLVIGLSGGGWLRALTTFPTVQKIEVVEINPGYVDLVSRYDAVRPVLSDPRVRIHIDDGRRWLKRHRGQPFDLIVMNTTFHWRAYSTNLLSAEFMHEIERNLAPGGIMTFNTTQSLDAFRTAGQVFPQVWRFQGFAYAARHDFRAAPAEAEHRLLQLRDGAGPVLAPQDFNGDGPGRRLAMASLEPLDQLLARHHDEVGVITDANLLTEYRHGKRTGVRLIDAMLPNRKDPLLRDLPVR